MSAAFKSISLLTPPRSPQQVHDRVKLLRLMPPVPSSSACLAPIISCMSEILLLVATSLADKSFLIAPASEVRELHA
jgi:hypothetical protein